LSTDHSKPSNEAASHDDIGFSRRLREVYRHTTLRPGEDQQLFRQIARGGHDADQARERLIQGVEQYVIREAKKLAGRGVELEDLIQEGITGVLRAIEKYDPEKGYAFLTYADDWIRQRMLRACEREGSIERYQMRIPCHQYMANGRVQRHIEKLREELGREPTAEELAKRAKLQNVQQAETALTLLNRSFTSLDAQRASEDSEVTVAEAIADPQAMDPVQEMEQQSNSSVVWQVFSRLSQDEQQVMSMRQGLNEEGRRYTQEEVCRQMGIKKSRLVSLQKSASRQLRAAPELREIADDILSAIE
jgi:RNA polymerase primary sigma factor